MDKYIVLKELLVQRIKLVGIIVLVVIVSLIVYSTNNDNNNAGAKIAEPNVRVNYLIDNIDKENVVNIIDSISCGFEVNEVSLSKIVLDGQTGLYDVEDTIQISYEEEDLNVLNVELSILNEKIQYIIIDTGEKGSILDIASILTEIVGEEIIDELMKKEDGILIEYSNSDGNSISTMKNTFVDGGGEIYVNLSRPKGEQSRLVDIQLKNEDVFNWINKSNRKISSTDFTSRLASLYRADAEVRILSIEEDNRYLPVNTTIGIQTVIGDTALNSTITFIGVEVVGLMDNETKMQKTIAAQLKMPSFQDKDIALDYASNFLVDLLGKEVELRSVSENTVLIENKDYGITGKFVFNEGLNDRVSVDIDVTVVDTEIINQYHELLEEVRTYGVGSITY